MVPLFSLVVLVLMMVLKVRAWAASLTFRDNADEENDCTLETSFCFGVIEEEENKSLDFVETSFALWEVGDE